LISATVVSYNSEITLGNLLTSAVLFATVLGAFFSLRERARSNLNAIQSLKERLDRVDVEQMKERTNTMWILQLRRGLVEAETRGLAMQESPLTLTDEAMRFLGPLIPKLRQFYRQMGGDQLSLIELADALEIHMGHEITEVVCRKVMGTGGHPVSDAACLVLAIAVLRPISTDTINEQAESTLAESQKLAALRDLPPKKEVKGGGVFGFLRR
jgi:hypothetical protein